MKNQRKIEDMKMGFMELNNDLLYKIKETKLPTKNNFEFFTEQNIEFSEFFFFEFEFFELTREL